MEYPEPDQLLACVLGACVVLAPVLALNTVVAESCTLGPNWLLADFLRPDLVLASVLPGVVVVFRDLLVAPHRCQATVAATHHCATERVHWNSKNGCPCGLILESPLQKRPHQAELATSNMYVHICHVVERRARSQDTAGNLGMLGSVASAARGRWGGGSRSFAHRACKHRRLQYIGKAEQAA